MNNSQSSSMNFAPAVENDDHVIKLTSQTDIFARATFWWGIPLFFFFKYIDDYLCPLHLCCPFELSQMCPCMEEHHKRNISFYPKGDYSITKEYSKIKHNCQSSSSIIIIIIIIMLTHSTHSLSPYFNTVIL